MTEPQNTKWVLHCFAGGAFYISIETPNGDAVHTEIAHVFAGRKTAKVIAAAREMMDALKPFADAMESTCEQVSEGNVFLLVPSEHVSIDDFRRALRAYYKASDRSLIGLEQTRFRTGEDTP